MKGFARGMLFCLLLFLSYGCATCPLDVGDYIYKAGTGIRTETLLEGQEYSLVKLIIPSGEDKYALVRKKDQIIVNLWPAYQFEKAVKSFTTIEKGKEKKKKRETSMTSPQKMDAEDFVRSTSSRRASVKEFSGGITKETCILLEKPFRKQIINPAGPNERGQLVLPVKFRFGEQVMLIQKIRKKGKNLFIPLWLKNESDVDFWLRINDLYLIASVDGKNYKAHLTNVKGLKGAWGGVLGDVFAIYGQHVIMPGETVKGELHFVVPPKANALTLHYEPHGAIIKCALNKEAFRRLGASCIIYTSYSLTEVPRFHVGQCANINGILVSVEQVTWQKDALSVEGKIKNLTKEKITLGSVTGHSEQFELRDQNNSALQCRLSEWRTLWPGEESTFSLKCSLEPGTKQAYLYYLMPVSGSLLQRWPAAQWILGPSIRE